MAIDYNWVKSERQQVLDKVKNLSESEFAFNFGFGEGSIKKSLLAIANLYQPSLSNKDGFASSLENYRDNEQTLNFADVEHYFNAIDAHVDADHPSTAQSIGEEFRRLGHIDTMLHIIDQEDHRIAERTSSRQKVTERLNMTITRL